MENEIQNNIVFLAEKLRNLDPILLHLIQNKIISQHESEEIQSESTTLKRNNKLLVLMQKKDWHEIKESFLKILRITGNGICVDAITGNEGDASGLKEPNLPTKCKWWPDKKVLIRSLHERKIGKKLFVEKLWDQILDSENKMAVICESAKASKYSGMGGIGKTLTAKWYAHHYEMKYEHILWIDCGEGSLVQSFKKLARNLRIEDRNELDDNEELVRACYEELTHWRCLWIFDNAESYKGSEGLMNILPKFRENFHCLITSRTREWGNWNGLKIAHFELNIFDDNETVIFLKENLKQEIECTEDKLKELGLLLGNLPLALQLAVAALNNGKINLQNYIDKTSSKDLENIVDTTFDDYERTINKNISISLDSISKEKYGKIASKILMIFGYIQPDDVRSKFLMIIKKCTLQILTEAIDLLEKYSLVTKTGKIHESPFYEGLCGKFGKNKKKIEMDVLSIHRLLQQVIRHNGRKTEEKVLKKILGCKEKEFLDYKLIPFTKYADENLRKQFSKVKAQLLDQEQLRKLIKAERFEESVQLARFIHEELKTETTKFNYSVCLEKNKQVQECVKILEEFPLKQKTQNILVRALEVLIAYFNDKELTIKEDRALLDLKRKPTDIEIWDLLFSSYLRLQKNKEALAVTKKIIVQIEQLIQIISATNIPNYYLKVEWDTVTLQLDGLTKTIELRGCSLDLSIVDLVPEDLRLYSVTFLRNGLELKEMTVNEFVDFNKINRLTLDCEKKKNISIDLSDLVSVEYLHLNGVRVVNWREAKWIVQHLSIVNVSFVERTAMKVKEMDISNSSLDISCLPQSIQKLKLTSTTRVFSTKNIQLPNLKYLELQPMNNTSLEYFRSIPLIHIHFDSMNEVNVDLLPESVKTIKITNSKSSTTVIHGGVRKLYKLILQGFTLQEFDQVLSHFQTDNLSFS